MTSYLSALFASGHIPKGECYQWDPGLVWTNVISDALIAFVHFAVALLVIFFLQKRKNIEYSRAFLYFITLFNILAGTLHLLNIFLIWEPVHSFETIIRLFTAASAICTIFFLVPVFPHFINLPNPGALKELNQKLENKIEELRQTEKIHQLLLEVTVAIATAKNTEEAFYFALKKICETTQWAYGDAWLYNNETDKMEFAGSYYGDKTPGLAEFSQKSSVISFSKGEGIPGRAWTKKNTIWKEDITNIQHLPRRLAAERANLKTALAFPIPLNNEVIAVLAFYMSEPSEEDEDFKEMITAIAGQLGMVLKQKKLIEEQMESELRFSSLNNSSPDAIVLSNSKGIILSVNKATERIFGYEEQELLNKSLTILMPEKYREMHTKGINRYLATKEARVIGKTVTLEGLRKDNTIFPMDLSVGTWEGKNEIFFSGIIRDVTERKMAEEELIRKNRELENSNTELERFAFVASHDMKEPLRMVSNYTQLLARRYKDKLDDEGKEYIDYAVEGVHRIQILINDLLEYARIGQMEMLYQNVDMNVVLQEALKNLSRQITEDNVQVHFQQLPVVYAIHSQMVQLLQNLINNAIKFRKENETPEIVINVEDDNNNWKFSLSDNGIGIDTKYADKIFVLFQRIHEWSKYQGTGIGLAICKKIVELHGGWIWFESEQGAGTTFYFTLPKIKAGK